MIRLIRALLPAGSDRQVVLHLVLTVVSVVLRAAGAVLLVPLVGALFGDHPAGAWPWLGLLAAATVAGWAVDAVAARIGADLGFGLLGHAQHSMADRLVGTRLTWFTADNTATARQAIAATGPDLVGLIIYLLTPLLVAVLLPIGIALALFLISWQLGLAALIGVPLLLGAFWAAGRSTRTADRTAARANRELTERLVEFARTQQALRSARRVTSARSAVGSALAGQHGASVRLLLMQIPGQLLYSLASQAALVLLAGSTVWLTIQGTLSVPEAIALIVVIARYLEPFAALAELGPGIENAVTVLGNLRSVLDAPAEDDHHDSAGWKGGGDPPQVELRGVSFGYRSDAPPVIDGLDLRIQAGTTTAIVGPSGSGKSTVLALLAGLYQPTDGQILVDHATLSARDPASYRELISMVFQQPYLFDGDIGDNIRIGHPDAAEDEFHRAAALARVDEIVARLPDGWQSRVGEGGTLLSGGERQRVSIARALLKPAPILLIDEATSALDQENEAAVVDALTIDPRPRTKVIVAHRLASIRTADRVVFLDNGRIVEQGPVDQLLAAGGRFADFWRQQDAAGGWRIAGRDGDYR